MTKFECYGDCRLSGRYRFMIKSNSYVYYCYTCKVSFNFSRDLCPCCEDKLEQRDLPTEWESI